MTRILIESGHERNRNGGDEAYYATLVFLFREMLGDVHITSFSDRPQRDRERYGVETVYSGGTLLKTLRSVPEILKTIRSCDVYVWGPGQILRDDTGLKSPLYRLSRPLAARWLGRPVMAYAAGIGPLDGKPVRLLARRVLNGFDLITVRDPFSKRLLAEMGVIQPVHETVDPAFALIAAPSSEVDATMAALGLDGGSPLVGIAPFGPAYRGVKSLLPSKYQVKFDMWKPGGRRKYLRHVNQMAHMCDMIATEYGASLLFIAQDSSWQGMDDRTAEDVTARMKSGGCTAFLKADDYPPGLLKGIMSRMEILVGGRMHSLILASSVSTPVLATCFEEKIRSFGKIIGQEEYFLDADKIDDAEEWCAAFGRLWSVRKRIRKDLGARMGPMKDKVRSNVLLLRRLIQESGTGA